MAKFGQGEAGQGEVRSGAARHGSARSGLAGHGMARFGGVRLGPARSGMVRLGPVWCGWARYGEARVPMAQKRMHLMTEIIRVWPAFHNWSTSGKLIVTDDGITDELLTIFLGIAGQRVGLGKFRPGGWPPGPFGTFKAEIECGTARRGRPWPG